MSNMSIPATEPGDSDDVTLALQTAEALWNKGDPNEALRWLRRAAEAAGHSGDDMRAVALAKAVADLNAAAPEQSSPRQVRPPPLPPQTPVTKTDALPDEVIESSTNAKGALKGVSKAPPPPPSARKSVTPKAPNTSPPEDRASSETDEGDAKPRSSAPQKMLNPPPPPGAGSRPPKDEPSSERVAPEETLGKAASRSAQSSAPVSTRSPLKRSTLAASKTPVGGAPSKSPSSAAKPGKQRSFARAALRVYVMTEEEDGEQLDVRVLQAGERPPPGAVEALLVPLRRGAKLLK